MTIGMRNVKTAISVFLCILVSRLLKLEFPFYAAIAAIIAMQGSVTASFKAGRTRMLGTFIGALVGFICALIRPESAILCGIGIIIVIYLCNILKWQQSTSIAGVVFLAIMLNLKDKNPLFYSSNRILDTFIGISISMLVNYFILPPDKFTTILKNFNDMFEDISAHIRDRVVFNKDIDLVDLDARITKLKNKLNTYVEDFKLKKGQAEQIGNLNKILDFYRDAYVHLKVICSIDNPMLNHDNINLINDFYNLSLDDIGYENTDSNIIFNYHVRNIVKDTSKIKLILEECNKAIN